MKEKITVKNLTLLSILLIGATSSFASESPKRKPAQAKCDSVVAQYAQSILDISGKALDFNGGAILETKSQGGGSYLISAAIYKGSYDLKISVDSSCVFQSASLIATGN
jgi:hypothetical protein